MNAEVVGPPVFLRTVHNLDIMELAIFNAVLGGATRISKFQIRFFRDP